MFANLAPLRDRKPTMRLAPLLALLLTPLILAAWMPARAQAAYVPVEQRLSAAQLDATGLSGLTSTQLQLLNRLLAGEQAVIERRVETSVRSRMAGLLDRQPGETVHASIKGDFRGWVAGRVFELDNGQRWRVSEGELYLRKPVANAKVTTTPGMVSGWYLQVEGQSPRAKVQRLP